MKHFFDNIGTVDFTMLPTVVLLLIFLALVFDFLNGFHDAANSVATIVSTRVLSPQQAVVWMNLVNGSVGYMPTAPLYDRLAAYFGRDPGQPGL